ncbi:aminoacyl-tRNA hydrolase [Candidatus Parcubacteria bacterium]|nr:aminoacyl-tRNA hydrolase [Candidatus Parcubacteria bacterium]MBI4099018.1 aminoacyl-tRNA hydrolase [Candidatus Parcubacteria bacterium]MBI4385308.1 aminoacyl-tRNA hydrolase [Candidatus Parcubacteria bacterium]
MKLIVGLGNIGVEYEHTRHNIGFRAVDAVANGAGLSWTTSSAFEAGIAEGAINSERVILMKPAPMMNDSGRAVAKVVRYYRIPLERIWTVHDDVDLPFGEIRIESDRGSAGHRGVQSVIDALGTREFHRVRIGVRNEQYRPGTKTADEFVLAEFTSEEETRLPAVIEKATAAIEHYPEGGSSPATQISS